MRVRLLHCLAGALVKHGGRFLFSLAPGGELLYDIAAEAWSAYRTTDNADSARAELEGLAQASADQVRQVVADAVKDVAAGYPAKVQEVLASYLTQVPASIRRSLRRPSDPSGKSVPASVAVRSAEDLVAFLPPRMPRFKPGDRPLPGVDWELEELAGVGGFGEVWKARHAFLHSKPPVALKFCLDNSAAAALRNEAGVLDRVMQHGKHGGIVPLLHTYLSADPPCLEYEYVEGGDLAGLIQEMHADGQPRPAVANRLLLGLAEIVAFAHQAEPPIVHGDLKPANVLVRRTADGQVALRIIDFGIGGVAAARAVQEARQPTRSRPALLTEAVRGAHTPLYASPEQMARRPGERADPRDDVHALGVIWYQLLTGDLGRMSIPPDRREQLVERGEGENLIRLLGACIAPKAEKRPVSAAVLVEQIKAANVPVVELAAAGARADRPHGAAPPVQLVKPEVVTPVVMQRGTPMPQPQAMLERRAAVKPSKNRLLLVGGAALVGVIGLCVVILLLQKGNAPPDRKDPLSMKVAAPGPVSEQKPPVSEQKAPLPLPQPTPKARSKVTKANFDCLTVGMTESQVEGWLGPANFIPDREEFAKALGAMSGEPTKEPWRKAFNEGKVVVFTDLGDTRILVGFSGDRSKDAQAEAFSYSQTGRVPAERVSVQIGAPSGKKVVGHATGPNGERINITAHGDGMGREWRFSYADGPKQHLPVPIGTIVTVQDVDNLPSFRGKRLQIEKTRVIELP